MKCFFCRACDEVWYSISAFTSAQDNTSALALADVRPELLCAAAQLRDNRPTQAFASFVDMAVEGSLWSMLNVAIAYERGDGVARNDSRAEYWYRRAWKGGSEAAGLRLVELLTSSHRLEEAEAMLALAVAEGKPVALRLLALIRLHAPRTPSKVAEGRALLERAFALGDLGAGFILSRYMAAGRFGLRRIPTGIRLAAVLIERISRDTATTDTKSTPKIDTAQRPPANIEAFGRVRGQGHPAMR